MMTHFTPRHEQRGAYLLEAMIGILIFALGALGIVGLQAASQRATTDSGLRAEAVFAANQLMGDMWADAQGALAGNYSSATSGASYATWAADLKAAQGGAWVQDPTVDLALVAAANCNPAPSTTSTTVYIQIFWRAADPTQNSCGVAGTSCFATCGLIGQNVQ